MRQAPTADFIHFFAVVFCALLAKGGTKTALFFTLCADYCLIFTDAYALGVFIFCFAQFFHLPKEKRRAAAFLLPLPVLLIFFFGPLPAAAAFYALLLVWNTALALRGHCPLRKAGFLLFCCCDAAVLLRQLGFAAANLIWPFYLPSQALLVLSSRRSAAPVQK